MSRKQRIIVSITGIILVSLILIGLTYAYFLTKITGNTNDKSISVTTANLQIKYEDNKEEILGENLILEPSDNEIGSKTFTVTNEGNSKTSYVVVIENVSVTKGGATTTFESNDFRYTLDCTEKDGSTCDGVSTQTVFPIKGGILVSNSIDVSDVQTYTFKMWYIDTGVDQSNDMGKTLQAKINIKDPNENPFKSNTKFLSYNIFNSAKMNLNGTELRATPLTKPAEESSLYNYSEGEFSDGTRNYSAVKTYNSTTAERYFTYGDTYVYDSSTKKYTITNSDGSDLKTVKLSSGYEILKKKYIVNTTGSSSTEPVAASNKTSIYYITDATATSIKYLTISSGFIGETNKYVTYGDSYKFDKNTGNYTIFNKDGSTLKQIKYSEGWDNVLINKYVGTTSLSNSYGSEPIDIKIDFLAKISNKSTFYQMAYQKKESKIYSIEKELSATNDDYGISYYYRGGVEDNYINFAGMCWRIVRIAGDGSIKISLENKDTTCELAKGAINASIGYANWGYDFSDGMIYKPDYLNGNLATTLREYQDTLASNINTVYSNKTISDYLKAGGWCLNDKAYASGSKNLINEINKEENYNNLTSFDYDTKVRLINSEIKMPTLECNGTVMNKFSDNENMYIAIVTADEVAFSGYPVEYDVDYRAIVLNFLKYDMTLSLNYFANDSGNSYSFNSNGYGILCDGMNAMGIEAANNVIPVIQLKSNVTVTGNGTKENPYVVE